MKVIGILRGFPGLGRVVSGVEILHQFEKQLGAKVKLFTYLQGYEYAKDCFNTSNIASERDISSIGIIPVSQSGEIIIDEIEVFNPDLILIDGEPLLLIAIKLRFPKIKVITLLNPFDVENPHNKLSSQLFFKDCYAKADLAIVHGIWQVEKPFEFCKEFISTNTILRSEIINIEPIPCRNKIVCVLGGGTVNGSDIFFENTLNISKKAILIANHYPDFQIEIFCSSTKIFEHVSILEGIPSNVVTHKTLKTPKEIFATAKLVIARAGRNTISELLHLKIPSLLFATSCNIRGSEQQTNLEKVQKISNQTLLGLDIHSTEKDILKTFDFLMDNQANNYVWECGNQELGKFISYHYV
jgi:hypothetical protein